MMVSAALGAVVYLGVFQQENANVGQLQGKLEQFSELHMVITIKKGISVVAIIHTHTHSLTSLVCKVH